MPPPQVMDTERLHRHLTFRGFCEAMMRAVDAPYGQRGAALGQMAVREASPWAERRSKRHHFARTYRAAKEASLWTVSAGAFAFGRP